MRKQYILDTSTLIVNPLSFTHFNHSDVIIPIVVLNELDNLKKQPNEAGKNARVCIRLIDDISNKGDISTGILLENDSLLKIDASYYENEGNFGNITYGDTQILICAYNYYLNHPTKDVILVSNDINLRIKAKARGLEAISHEENNTISELYSGLHTFVNEEAGLFLQKEGFLNPKDYELDLSINQCVMFLDEDDNGISLGRKVAENNIKPIKKNHPWGLQARNREQSFAIDLLMDTNLDLVTLSGISGTGKSLICLATALELVLNRKHYDKLIIYRPFQEMGAPIGFLPGELDAKIAPWFQPILDNIEVLLSNNKNGDHWKKDFEMFQKKGLIEFGALTYIRGRSIPNALILLDEAQNLSKEEIKTILTRAGENTKIILTGDIYQIDNSGLDAINNGLSYIIEKFKNSPLAGHITLTQGERSRLAAEAAAIL